MKPPKLRPSPPYCDMDVSKWRYEDLSSVAGADRHLIRDKNGDWVATVGSRAVATAIIRAVKSKGAR